MKNVSPALATASIVITGLCGLMYLCLQQVVRHGLNEPQVTLVTKVGHALDANQVIEHLIPQERVDIGAELSPWIVLYDNDFRPIKGSGYLSDALATVPEGLLGQPGSGITHRVSWQSEQGVRHAIVVYTVRRAEGAVYVVSGRNMREGERTIGEIGKLVLAGWAMLLIFAYVTLRYSGK